MFRTAGAVGMGRSGRRALALAAPLLLAAVGAQAASKPAGDDWDTTRARGRTRTIDFESSEGTWMSVDVSPDGAWLAFDLLAHVYRVRAAGGPAECLTADSGIAINFGPRYSPDGRSIAFVSDRGGQNNPWLMDADGGNPRPVFVDPDVRVSELAWTPDGEFLVLSYLRFGEGWEPESEGLHLVHRDGGSGIELLTAESQRGGGHDGAPRWPTLSPDGRFVTYHVAVCPGEDQGGTDPLRGCHQLRRLDLRTGEILELTTGVAEQQYRSSAGGAFAPELSPDGRWLAFARRIPDGRIRFKGHEYGPRTALWLRDLERGAEAVAMDPIEPDLAAQGDVGRLLPAYAWAADGKSIAIAQGGRLRRLRLADADDVRGRVAGARVEDVPFTARVRRKVSQRVTHELRIGDEPFSARFLRWQSRSPDGRRLAFQAVGRVWVMEWPGGSPRRLTPEEFAPLEFAPAWSPDGRWIAFTSWDDGAGGHLWKARPGEPPERLSAEPGEYLHPAWSPDGRFLVVARGDGAAARGRSQLYNAGYALVRVPAAGGPAELVVRPATPLGIGPAERERLQIVRASFGPEGRVFFPELVAGEGDEQGELWTRLASVQPDGGDRREHLLFRHSDEMVVSPDGRRVAFVKGDNVYATRLPIHGTGAAPPRVTPGGPLPITRLSRRGGLHPTWWDARTLEFGSGAVHFVHDFEEGETRQTRIELRVPREIPRGRIALRGGRIVTMQDRRVIESGTLVVDGSRIVCVAVDCDLSGADRLIDASGHTLIPGLVDMHSHHYFEHRGIQPRRDFEQAIYLAYGITANMEPSIWSQTVFPAAELIDAGVVLGPRTFSTGDPLYQGDGTRQNELTSAEVAREEVERLVSWGATSIKQYLQPRRAQRQWVVEAARRAGATVTAESGDLEFVLSLVMDGHTGWEHPLDVVPLHSDVTRFIGAAGTVYSATLGVGGPGVWNEEFFFQERPLWRDPKLRRWVPWRQLVPHTRRHTAYPATDWSFPLLAQGLADVLAAGGAGAVGAHGQQHGIGSHWEVWMAASAMGPHAALELATLGGARFLGAERDLGSLEVGKLADLLVLRANPLLDVRATADIRYVMKGGRLYDADSLDQVWPEAVPFGPHYWLDPDALRDDVRPAGPEQ